MTTISFWGTGDSMGVPRVYCSCGVCEEARSGGVNRRRRPLVHIADPSFGEMLIDCGPDWREQMEMAGTRFIDRILVTHAHFDHIAGLAEWADACRWLERRGEAYARADVIRDILTRYPWLERNVRFVPLEGMVTFGDWHFDTWLVNHGKNGYSYAFKFTHVSDGRAWAYCSDSIALTAEQRAPLFGLDLLVLGTSFYEEPYPMETRSLYDVKEALELLEELKPRRTWFTHMSHDIDLRRQYALPENIAFAFSGLQVNV
ncbi:MBL fold metallo-hydrolase [Paenibacillus methanolicus]|uniref:Phosphoribosyl 1,2-cyclic phosphate phosphodiesterase n=1 Tax=Paenibacillus methanolicus TaxID=582686 RepID=A0A5S5C236_9BACL|nr:MBL fold metallo-hydrolase [Paenibacillus methanolicus]TYP72532.1 phosphoribosyl 1,2-cyclic phosphate phosphodiesterase [Paenibacillus methanolicus]